MKKSLFIPALALMAWETSFAGIRLSQFEVQPSGHYAQVVLGSAAIQPITLKLKNISFAGANQCGLTLTITGDIAKLSGAPTVESCVMLFRGLSPVDDSPIDLPVEIYKLADAPVPPESDALLAALPKLPPNQLNEVFITDDLPPVHADFNMDQYFTKVYDLHVPGTSDGKPQLNEVRADQTQMDTATPKPYRSCAFTDDQRQVGIDPDNYDAFALIKLLPDQLAGATIEHCKLSGLATWDTGGDEADMINIFVVKSYL